MKRLILAFVTFFTLIAQPAVAQGLVEGKHFVRLQMPQPTEIAGKVDVIEFFWYGCPHCAELHPLLKSWAKKLPADVSFRRVPAIFRDSWVPGARTFYALEAMGQLEKMDDALFHAIHKERINLTDEKILFDWMGKQGVDRQKFIDMYKSFGVDGKVRKAAEMSQEYGISGVPAMIVGGKYMPAPNLGTYGDMLAVVDGLIAKNRAEIKK